MTTDHATSMKERRKNIHTISLFVSHTPGVLLRICLIFARRGFNIESLVVSSAVDGRFARMTITAAGDRPTLEQIIKQLNKMVDTVSCYEHTDQDAVETELALIKLEVTPENRTEVLQIAEHFKATTVDFSEESMIFKVSGTTEKLDAIVDMFSRYNLLEVVRSGKMLMTRGKQKT